MGSVWCENVLQPHPALREQSKAALPGVCDYFLCLIVRVDTKFCFHSAIEGGCGDFPLS